MMRHKGSFKGNGNGLYLESGGGLIVIYNF